MPREWLRGQWNASKGGWIVFVPMVDGKATLVEYVGNANVARHMARIRNRCVW